MKRWFLRKLGRCCAVSHEGVICAKRFGHNRNDPMSLHLGWNKDYGHAWGGIFEEEEH